MHCPVRLVRGRAGARFAVADLVRACLTGPAGIAIDFAGDFFRLRTVAFDKETACLFAGPAFVVQSGIDHQTAGAERQRLEVAQPSDFEVVIGAKLVRQLLAIQRPAFGKRAKGEDRADQRQAV